jgi:hypothetical protein
LTVAGLGLRRPPVVRRRVVLPIVLFLATCVSTFWTGTVGWMPELCLGRFEQAERLLRHASEQAASAEASQGVLAGLGLVYMVAVLGILLRHEMGHFLVALRHKIPASLPNGFLAGCSDRHDSGATMRVRLGLLKRCAL